MKLQEVFDKLVFGELSQHTLGRGNVVQEKDIPALIAHVNVALKALNKKFSLVTKEVILEQQAGLTQYVFDKKYTASGGGNPAYILDSVESPFEDDIIQIDGVYDSLGSLVPMNDELQDNSVFVSSYDSIQVPYPVAGQKLHIIYRSAHPVIPSDADPLTTEVFIPDSLEEALLAYVAYRAFSGSLSQEAMNAKVFYLQKYEQICTEMGKGNLLNEPRVTTNIKPYLGGWI